MLKVLNPSSENWAELLQRPVSDVASAVASVKPILEGVRKRGDVALFDFCEKFDKVRPTSLKVSLEELKKSAQEISSDLKE